MCELKLSEIIAHYKMNFDHINMLYAIRNWINEVPSLSLVEDRSLFTPSLAGISAYLCDALTGRC